MSRLHVTLEVAHRPLVLPEYLLERATSDCASTSEVVHAAANELIHSDDHSTVYRASLDDQSVILKFCLRPDLLTHLERETIAYQGPLLKLQGTVVPRFFGFYKGHFGDGFPMGCIVLEDCGNSLDRYFEDLPWDDKRKILGQLGVMHLQGHCHPKDFAERNVVHKDGQFRLIDFHSVVDHPCGWSGNWHLEEIIPHHSKFGCSLLRHWGNEMSFWRLGNNVTVFSKEILNLGQLPTQEIIDQLIPSSDDFVDVLWNRSDLIHWLEVCHGNMQEDREAGRETDLRAMKKTMPKFQCDRTWLEPKPRAKARSKAKKVRHM